MDFNNLERKTKAELFELIQSKQAEIDKVKKLLNQWDNWISASANHNCIEIVKECADELREILR